MSDDKFPGEGCVSEQAEKLRFHADQNCWETFQTEIKVAKKMFEHGDIYGCIRFLDVQEGAVKVLKKAMKVVETVDDIHNGVKMQCLGELCANLFSSVAPEVCSTSFVPCLVYVLKQRPNQPSVRVEEYVQHDHVKREISVNPPQNASIQDVLDSHKFSAFQFFTYIQSDRNMVFISAVKVNHRMLTRPVVASLDHNLGGKDDRGADGIAQWVAEFTHKYSPLLGLSKEQIFSADPIQLITLMDSKGLFTAPAQALLPAQAPAPLPAPLPALAAASPATYGPSGASAGPRTAAAAATVGPVAQRSAEWGPGPVERAARPFDSEVAGTPLPAAAASLVFQCTPSPRTHTAFPSPSLLCSFPAPSLLLPCCFHPSPSLLCFHVFTPSL
jgi:hypothetical protein